MTKRMNLKFGIVVLLNPNTLDVKLNTNWVLTLRNCLFHSVAYDLFGTQENHHDIQIRVVNLVITDWVMYKDF